MKTYVSNMFNFSNLRHLQRVVMFFLFLTFTASVFALNWEGTATVTVNKTGNGRIYIDNVEVNTASKDIEADEGESASANFELKAEPNDNNVFIGWSESENGTILSTNNPYTATVTGTEDSPKPSKTYWANFAEIESKYVGDSPKTLWFFSIFKDLFYIKYICEKSTQKNCEKIFTKCSKCSKIYSV